MKENSYKATILIVDDQPENIDVLSNILRNEYKVKAATSGEKALAIIHKKGLPDLIFLDVMMPDMDGYEVCKQLKQDSLTRDIPVVFVSALTDASEQKKASVCGAAKYICKPVQPDEVRSVARIYI